MVRRRASRTSSIRAFQGRRLELDTPRTRPAGRKGQSMNAGSAVQAPDSGLAGWSRRRGNVGQPSRQSVSPRRKMGFVGLSFVRLAVAAMALVRWPTSALPRDSTRCASSRRPYPACWVSIAAERRRASRCRRHCKHCPGISATDQHRNRGADSPRTANYRQGHWKLCRDSRCRRGLSLEIIGQRHHAIWAVAGAALLQGFYNPPTKPILRSRSGPEVAT
jgi:hypothetical protein